MDVDEEDDPTHKNQEEYQLLILWTWWNENNENKLTHHAIFWNRNTKDWKQGWL